MSNPSYEQRKQALIAEITAAFDGVSRENGVSLSETQVIDDYGSVEERAAARLEDTETRWQDVPEDDIAHGAQCLSFLDPIGFRYYIPAYMIWYLHHKDDEFESPSWGSDTFGSIEYHLTLEKWGQWEEYWLNKSSLFTPEESKAIALFLEFVAERHEAYFLEFESKKEDAFQEKSELWLQETLSNSGLSQEEIDAKKQDFKQFRREHILAEYRAGSDERLALERYWGQFL